jgi:hypothetical protein
MFKRTAGVSCSLKESIDGLEIIVCGKMFHCTMECEKNDHLYVSVCVVICLNVLIVWFSSSAVGWDEYVVWDSN